MRAPSPRKLVYGLTALSGVIGFLLGVLPDRDFQRLGAPKFLAMWIGLSLIVISYVEAQAAKIRRVPVSDRSQPEARLFREVAFIYLALAAACIVGYFVGTTL